MPVSGLIVQARDRLAGAWPAVDSGMVEERLLYDTRPLAPASLAFPLPPFLRALHERWHAQADVCYVKRYRGRLRVDPVSGHVFIGRRVVRGSTDVERARSRERNPRFALHLLRRGRHVEAGILLHHKFFRNYFHFFNNVVAKAALADRAGIPADVPWIAPAGCRDLPFMRGAVAMGAFGAREIVWQKHREVLSAEVLYVLKPFDIDRAALDVALDRMGLARRPEGGRRIFIRRGPNAPNRRWFRNQAALEAWLGGRGFDFVDPEQLSLAEQAACFAQADVLVAPHGAGLTNLLFRREAPAVVVEMFNPNLMSLHYALIADAWRHRYHAVLNRDPRGKASVATSEADMDALAACLGPLLS